jgi:hypothetical protein
MVATQAPELTDEQVVEVLALLKEVDSVELKVTVPSESQRAAAEGLDLDPLDAQVRQVFFFDTPELALNEAGVVVRARRVQGKGDDTVVKLRPVVPHELPDEIRLSPSFGVEVDAMPGGFVCSGSYKGVLPKPRVRKTLGSGGPLRKLFSKEQRAFYAEHALEGVDLDDLSVLGPIFVLKVKYAPPELGRKIVGEMWLYPDGSRLLELSTKCAPGEAFQVAAETRGFLTSRGIDLSGAQETKTRKALEFFAAELAAGGPAA